MDQIKKNQKALALEIEAEQDFERKTQLMDCYLDIVDLFDFIAEDWEPTTTTLSHPLLRYVQNIH